MARNQLIGVFLNIVYFLGSGHVLQASWFTLWAPWFSWWAVDRLAMSHGPWLINANSNWHKYSHYLSVIFLWRLFLVLPNPKYYQTNLKYYQNVGHPMMLQIPQFHLSLSDIFCFFVPKNIRSACIDIFCFLLDHLSGLSGWISRGLKQKSISYRQ